MDLSKMSFDQANLEPFLDSIGADDQQNQASVNPVATSQKRSKSAKLIQKEGKTVSLTSTGKRKFHNKSKSGCDTCKRRRVKCDEGKPYCVKCKNMGISCTYSISDAKKKSASSEAESSDQSTQESVHKSRASSRPPKETKLPHQNFENLMPKSVLEQLQSSGILQQDDLSPLLALASKLKLPDLTFPSFNVKSPPSLTDLSSNPQPPVDPLLSLRSSIIANNVNIKEERNNLTLNLGSMTNNPTISPQPSMSPGSQTSPLSTNHRIPHHSHHHNDQQDFGNSSSNLNPMMSFGSNNSLNLIDLKLMYHYTTVVAPTITTAGISEQKIWREEIPELAFDYPFLMHSILAFAATHLSRTVSTLEASVTHHRGEALRLLREAVLEMSPGNTDALVASALILIMDSLANASLPSSLSPTSLPASAWIFHVKGAATILTAVWPLPVTSRFYKFISVDLSDLGDIINDKSGISELVCFDESIADLYPVEYDSPYLITLAYLDKLHHERYKSDFILRIFAFPALLDKTFLSLLMSGDLSAMRIMRSYYSLLRGFTTEMKDKVWFLEGVSKVLPADVDDYTGGGGMHMMLDFLGGGLPSMTTTNLSLGLNIDINDHFMNP